MANEVSLEIDVKTAKALRKIGSFGDSFKSSLGVASLAITGLNQGFQLMGKGLDLLGAGFDSTIGSALEFEDSIAEITTLIDESDASTKDLNKTVLGLQKTFGGRSDVKAKAYYNAISSGAVTAANAQNFLTEANKLAIGGITDLGTSVDGLTTIISAFGLEAEDTTEINDALFIAMKRGKTTIGELSRGIGVAAASSATLGVEYTELLAATSALTTGGITTNVAFTQIRATMTALSKPTKELQKIYDRLNITSIKTQIEQDGLVGTLKKLVSQTDGSAESINKLFGSVEAVGAISSITSETIGGTFNAAMGDMANAAENAGAVTEEAFNKINNTTSQKVKKLKGTVEAGFKDIGLSITERMGPAVDFATERMDGLLSAVKVGFETFFNSLGKTSNKIDFGKIIDSGIQLIIKGLGKSIDLAADLTLGILDIVDAVNDMSNTQADFGIFDKLLIGTSIYISGIKKSFLEANKAMNDFWGQNETQAKNSQDAIDAIEQDIVELNGLLDEKPELDIETQKTKDNIEDLKTGVESLQVAAAKGFEAIDKEIEKGIVVKVTEVEMPTEFTGPMPEFVGPRIPEVGIDTKELEKADSKISAKDEKILTGFGTDLASGLSKGAKGANELFKKGAVVAATAAFGPLGQVAGPIADLLLLGPKKAKEMIESFIDQIPVIIDTIAETAPVIITTLAENIDKIIIPLSDPVLWTGVAIAVGKAFVTEAIPIMAQKTGEAFQKALLDFDMGMQEGVAGFSQGISDAGDYFAEQINAIGAEFQAFIDLTPFDGFVTSMEKLVEQISDVLGIDTPEISTGSSQTDDIAKLILAPFTGGASLEMSNGGDIPKGFPNDSFNANLESGEAVITASTTEKLNQYLDSQGGQLGLLSQILEALQGGQVVEATIEMDGDALAKSILNLNRQNARLA